MRRVWIADPSVKGASASDGNTIVVFLALTPSSSFSSRCGHGWDIRSDSDAPGISHGLSADTRITRMDSADWFAQTTCGGRHLSGIKYRNPLIRDDRRRIASALRHRARRGQILLALPHARPSRGERRPTRYHPAMTRAYLVGFVAAVVVARHRRWGQRFRRSCIRAALRECTRSPRRTPSADRDR